MFGFSECRVNGKTARQEDFKVGATIAVPSGLGGVFSAKVTEINGDMAVLKKPFCRDHGAITFNVYVNPPQMDDRQLLALRDVMRKFHNSNAYPNKEELALLNLGRINGFVYRGNSWGWLQAGIDALRALD